MRILSEHREVGMYVVKNTTFVKKVPYLLWAMML